MSESVIDQAVFSELKDAGGMEFAVELVDTFLEEAPGILTELRSAQAQGDVDGFRRAAHSLKSNGNTFGASTLATLARELELGGMNADPALDLEAITALEAEYERTAAALKELCNG
jgi:HPt (histidine-containing phosphotransfer) domain-containing protein